VSSKTGELQTPDERFATISIAREVDGVAVTRSQKRASTAR